MRQTVGAVNISFLGNISACCIISVLFAPPSKKLTGCLRSQRRRGAKKRAALNKIRSHGSNRFKSKMHDSTVISVKSPKCSPRVKELQCYKDTCYWVLIAGSRQTVNQFSLVLVIHRTYLSASVVPAVITLLSNLSLTEQRHLSIFQVSVLIDHCVHLLTE